MTVNYRILQNIHPLGHSTMYFVELYFFLEYDKVIESLKNKELNNVILVQRTIKDALTERVSDVLTLSDLVQLHAKDGAVVGHMHLTIQDYINKADEAMYSIKKSGKNHYKLSPTTT